MSSAKQDKSDVEKGVEKIYFEIAKKQKLWKKCWFGLHGACKQENKTKSLEFVLLLMFGISSECCKNENTWMKIKSNRK